MGIKNYLYEVELDKEKSFLEWATPPKGWYSKSQAVRTKLENGLYKCTKTYIEAGPGTPPVRAQIEHIHPYSVHHEDVRGRKQGIEELWSRYDNSDFPVPDRRYSYLDDELDGKCYDFWDEAHTQIKCLTTYECGAKNGPYIEYDQNGTIRKKSFFKNGKLDGYSEEYDENGTLRKKSFYKNGKLDGTSVEYDEKRKPIKRSVYKNGKFIEDNTGLKRKGVRALLSLAGKLPASKGRWTLKKTLARSYRKFDPKSKKESSI